MRNSVITQLLNYNFLMLPSRQITIHLARIGNPTRSYTEGFVEDDGIRLKSFSLVPTEVSERLSEKFRQYGWFQPGAKLGSVSKYHFYLEYFSILEYRDRNSQLLGYYCDIVTPLQREGDEYFLTDLILDLWVFPNLDFQELDRDEFEEAGTTGLLSPEFHLKALQTLERLKHEIVVGKFPSAYL